MIVAARVLFGINLEGAPKKAIIRKLKVLKYTIRSNTKDLGKKDIDPNYIMCESLLPNVTEIVGYISRIYNLHDGIKCVTPLHIELIDEEVDAYKGKDAPDKNIVIVSLINNQLRKVLRDKPDKEKVIQDKIEDLFFGANLDGQFIRETEHVPYSSKSSVPDFTFSELNTVVEVKLCKTKDSEKDIISQINDDILTYKKKYSNIIFVVYDLGIIRNQEKFKADIEANNVVVIIVKH
jgi:REase_DpnII-MboI